MRVLGVDLPRPAAAAPRPSEFTLVALDSQGRLAANERVGSLPDLVSTVLRLAAGEPFLLGVNVPVVVPAKSARLRPVESLVRRRFGYRLPPGGRSVLHEEPLGVAAETLMVGLAAAGHPCLPYPDRDRRRSGLAETHPGLALKVLLWQSSGLAASRETARLEELFRAYPAPALLAFQPPPRIAWSEHAASLDLVLRLLQPVEGFDLSEARRLLTAAGAAREVEQAWAMLAATLIAGTGRRYLEAPEDCLFAGDRENGYVILPADGFIRRLGSSESRSSRGRLFPQASLGERLGSHAQLRPIDLLGIPGRPQRIEAQFKEPPRYEFDNLDEMLWWKHCRHLAGATLPTEGLKELAVVLDHARANGAGSAGLSLVRSRHMTLSFRFEPPAAWRAHVPIRDGKTYSFRVLRAVYETLPAHQS